MTTYLFDTNVISEIMRHPHGALAQRVAALDDASRCTSIMVACELRYGAAKKQSARISHQLETVLAGFRIEPFEQPAEKEFGILRALLEREGRVIGAFDMLIAAHAIALDCTLVTDNMREFERVDGLRIENWLRN